MEVKFNVIIPPSCHEYFWLREGLAVDLMEENENSSR
jgi:hypothetical protein